MNQAPSKDPCIYGNPTGTTTIVLFGDSHALSWFPAVDALAQTRGWRLLSLTMSACSPSDIAAWNALSRIENAHPAIVLISGTRGFETVNPSGQVLAGSARQSAWTLGMKRTVNRIKTFSDNVILMADTPVSAVDPPVCLSSHPANVLACATSVSTAIDSHWLALETSIATVEKIGFIDPQGWVCPSSPCPVVYNDFLIYQDGGHLTATFSTSLANVLNSAITKVTYKKFASPAPVSTKK
jgi:hypothetical protein